MLGESLYNEVPCPGGLEPGRYSQVLGFNASWVMVTWYPYPFEQTDRKTNRPT